MLDRVDAWEAEQTEWKPSINALYQARDALAARFPTAAPYAPSTSAANGTQALPSLGEEGGNGGGRWQGRRAPRSGGRRRGAGGPG